MKCEDGRMFSGVTLNWGVLVSWSALRSTLDPTIVPLYLACVVYTVFYDTIYSHQVLADHLVTYLCCLRDGRVGRWLRIIGRLCFFS